MILIFHPWSITILRTGNAPLAWRVTAEEQPCTLVL